MFAVYIQAQRRWLSILLFLFFCVVCLPAQGQAYIGPGAGFTFVSSFLIVFGAFGLAFLTLLTWPVRWVMRKIRGRKVLAKVSDPMPLHVNAAVKAGPSSPRVENLIVG